MTKSKEELLKMVDEAEATNSIIYSYLCDCYYSAQKYRTIINDVYDFQSNIWGRGVEIVSMQEAKTRIQEGIEGCRQIMKYWQELYDAINVVE
jgi:hypothetical protein